MTTATATLTRNAISPFIDAAVARFPVGERAVKAAELLLGGKVQRLDDDRQGRDRWAVYGSGTMPGGQPRPYRVSIKAGTCDCPDRAAPASPQGQKLCKHMLAAMYALKASITAPATAPGLLAQALAAAETVVKLYVREEWTGDVNRIQRDLLHAYRVDDATERVNLAQPLDVSMDQHAVYETIDGAGWEIGTRYRSHGGMHVWELTPKPTPAAETALFASAALNYDEDDELWA